MTTMILDGYNVIGRVPELNRLWDRDARTAREALVSLCREYRAKRKDVDRLCVVFDGKEAYVDWPQPLLGGVTVVFSQGEDADARIVRMVRTEEGRGRCVVVSDDKELMGKTHALGARVMSAQEFYEKTRPSSVKGRRSQSRNVVERGTLSPREAKQITEELRKHLEK